METSSQLDTVANPLVAQSIKGWAAMVGFSALVGEYVSTRQIIPGIF
tara:strand:+ start:974 stop:1114 length:141 start_codon:yes stop_codon:yes gene_type:complete